MNIKAPRGTKDILPQEIELWYLIEDIVKQTFIAYGYKEIRTPIFEFTELFIRGIGDTTDIVTKEMYTFTDRKGRSLTLRPENTASVVRAYLEHNLGIHQGGITKLFYIGPMFRYERPQAGRQRQFYQFGTEAIGSSHPGIDAETIAMIIQIFNKIGITDVVPEINSVGCDICRNEYREILVNYFSRYIDEMCNDCRMRLAKNPLRILDCKVSSCQRYILECPPVVNSICNTCSKHLDDVIKYLDIMNITSVINSRLVRGLDYYTRTAFEIKEKSLGAQDAIAAGGRYDNLIKDMGGVSTPAVGFAAGMERIILAMKNRGIISSDEKLTVYVATTSENVKDKALILIQKLREHSIIVEFSWDKKSMKAQLRQASNMKATYTIIIGDEEIAKNKVGIKSMKDGKQEMIGIDEVIGYIKRYSDK
jgi:histidyl-tRNA synthetase